MRMPQRLVTGVAALVLVGGVTVVAAAPAEAAVRPAATGCAFKTGTTSEVSTNTHGLPNITGGSAFTKPSTSATTCHDFNLWSGKIGASYEGWLRYSNGAWGACSAGYVKYSGGSIVLCSDVLAGTVEAVTSSVGVGQSIEIED